MSNADLLPTRPDPPIACTACGQGQYEGFGFRPPFLDSAPAFRICWRCLYKALVWAAQNSTLQLPDDWKPPLVENPSMDEYLVPQPGEDVAFE